MVAYTAEPINEFRIRQLGLFSCNLAKSQCGYCSSYRAYITYSVL